MIETRRRRAQGYLSEAVGSRPQASDIADAAVALLSGPSDTVVTSDPTDITVLVDASRTGARVMPI